MVIFVERFSKVVFAEIFYFNVSANNLMNLSLILIYSGWYDSNRIE